MNSAVTASDLLAELDLIIQHTTEMARTCRAADREDEAECADHIKAGLTAFRDRVRSQDFLLELIARKRKKTT